MEQVYALGVSIIEFIQDWFDDYAGYFELVNDVSNPHHSLELLFPLMSIVDSVFAAQLVLCMAFGGWLNAVMKWWLLEDRPYWWVRETDFYAGTQAPVIRQTSQTCETGPGSPSGHSMFTAMLLILTICWLSHIMTDRKLQCVSWWKYVWYPLCAASLGSVMLARLYVGTHFPHQVVAGALLGGFLAPFLCIYLVDPYIFRYGYHARASVGRTVFWHCMSALTTIAIGVVTYFSLVWCKFDPQWTVKLAFRWCEEPDSIHVSTTPMYALVQSTGHLLGWALCVTPAVTQYRHDTQSRSLLIATFATGCIFYGLRTLQKNISKDSALVFYSLMFCLCVIKVPLLLRLTPALAMYPYEQNLKTSNKQNPSKISKTNKLTKKVN